MLTMKKSLLATSILGLSISVAAFSSMFSLQAEEKAATDVVIATVNGDKIMKSTLDGYMAILKKSGKGERASWKDPGAKFLSGF